jgi:hypothetical protein
VQIVPKLLFSVVYIDHDRDHDPDRDHDHDRDHDPDRDPDHDRDHDPDPDHDRDRDHDHDRDPDRDPDHDRDHDPEIDQVLMFPKTSVFIWFLSVLCSPKGTHRR